MMMMSIFNDGDDNAGFGQEGRKGSSRDSPQGRSRFQWQGEHHNGNLIFYGHADSSCQTVMTQVKLKDYLEILDVNDIKVRVDDGSGPLL